MSANQRSYLCPIYVWKPLDCSFLITRHFSTIYDSFFAGSKFTTQIYWLQNFQQQEQKCIVQNKTQWVKIHQKWLIIQKLLPFYNKKRDLKGFKCMTVSLDVFEDIPRLIETSRISRLSNRKNFNFKFLIFCESFHYFANQSYILWIIPIYLTIPIFCE